MTEYAAVNSETEVHFDESEVSVDEPIGGRDQFKIVDQHTQHMWVLQELAVIVELDAILKKTSSLQDPKSLITEIHTFLAKQFSDPSKAAMVIILCTEPNNQDILPVLLEEANFFSLSTPSGYDNLKSTEEKSAVLAGVLLESMNVQPQSMDIPSDIPESYAVFRQRNHALTDSDLDDYLDAINS